MSHFGYKPMQVRLFWLSLLQNKPNIPNSLNRLMASSDGQLCLYFWLSLSLAFLSPKSILNEKKASIGSCSIQIDQSLELSYGATTTTTAAAAATTTTIGGIIINMIIRRSRAATRNRERERWRRKRPSCCCIVLATADAYSTTTETTTSQPFKAPLLFSRFLFAIPT